jgi:hypothetical protein
VQKDIILKKQDEHFQLLADARVNSLAAFRFLSYMNKPDIAEKVLLEGIEAVRSEIDKRVNMEHKKMLNKKEEQKCRILILKSRLLFGVCDAWDVLKEGECSVRITLEDDGQAKALKGTSVSVIRNPCLHPGDWRKLKVVDAPELAHLQDCIVFSTRGRRPAADMMSGGDLDGDQCESIWWSIPT